MEEILALFRAEWFHEMPKEMKRDEKLKNLKLKGPFGPYHETLRKTYYEIRDKREISRDYKKIEEAHEIICKKSQGLFERNDDVTKELCIICEEVGKILGQPPNIS